MSWRDQTLYFIRHGETDWNAERRIQGTSDIELNDTGRAQAARHGATMAELDEDWTSFDFAASPLIRTRQTYQIVASHLSDDIAPVRYDSRLREIEFNRWEGCTWSDIESTEPEGHATYRTRGWDEAPHGGESYGDVAARVNSWLETVSRDTVIVSHGGVSRVLRALYLGLEGNSATDLPVPQTTFFRFRGGQVDRI